METKRTTKTIGRLFEKNQLILLSRKTLNTCVGHNKGRVTVQDHNRFLPKDDNGEDDGWSNKAHAKDHAFSRPQWHIESR